MFRILICDDNQDTINKLKYITEAFFDEKGIKIKIHSYLDASQISDHILSSCDIALLDVDFESKNYNGIDIARRLRSVRKDAIIIFITNYIEYAPIGYEVQAFRYILKREVDTDLVEYLCQALDQLHEKKETIKIQINGEIIDLVLDKILYLDVHQHNVTIHMQKEHTGKIPKTYTFYAALSELEEQLQSRGFLRIHKSYLVNMRHLKKFQCRQAELDNGLILRVSEKNYAENKKKYLIWKGWN